jgi:tetratricopeptide (TPR) repeat protein
MRLIFLTYLIVTLLMLVSCQENVRNSRQGFDPAVREKMQQEASAFLRLSELHFSNGYKKYGLENLKNAFIKNPYDEQSFVEVTKILEEEEDWVTLVDFFNYAIEKYGAHALLFKNVGVCYYKLGEFHKAANSFRNAVAMDSMDPQNYVYLAQTYEKLSKPEDALSTWNLLLIILERLPNLPDAQEFHDQAIRNKEKLQKSMGLPISSTR